MVTVYLTAFPNATRLQQPQLKQQQEQTTTQGPCYKRSNKDFAYIWWRSARQQVSIQP